METKSLSLSKSDFKLLKEHLEKSNMSAYNKEKLREELKAATIYTEEELPLDVVCLKSEARIANVKTGKEFTFKLALKVNGFIGFTEPKKLNPKELLEPTFS